MTIDVVSLERIAAQGWQARDTRWLGDWLLRADGGFTGRANSVLPLGAPDRPLDDALAAVRDWYGARGLTPRFAVPSPAADGLGGALVDRGWRHAWGARVMVAPLHTLPAVGAAGPEVRVTPAPSPGWRAAYHYRGGGSLPTSAVDLLLRADVVGFAQVVDGPDVVAIGRGTVVDGWLGITAVEVAATHRRRGLATAVLAGLAGWAVRHDATDAYLQVDTTNDVAAAMYLRAGFVDHHTYDYVEAPGS